MGVGFVTALRKLLPRGAAWRATPDSLMHKLLLGLSDEFDRNHDRAAQLLAELDPRTTNELLADWERVYGLPDPCVGEDQSTAQRRASLIQRIASQGGQTKDYYIAVAAMLGYTITIDEFHAHSVADSVVHGLYGTDWNFVWQVNAPLDTIRYKAVNDAVSDPLSTFGNAQLECVLQRLKPAHTHIIFAYS